MKVKFVNELDDGIDIKWLTYDGKDRVYTVPADKYEVSGTEKGPTQWAKPGPITFRGYISGTTTQLQVNNKDSETVEFQDKEDHPETRLDFVLGGGM